MMLGAPPDVAPRNLALLLQYQPEAAKGLLEHLRRQREEKRPPRFGVEPSTGGSPILFKREGNKTIALLDPHQPARAAETAAARIRAHPPGLLVIYSIGLGFLPLALQVQLQRSRMLIVEPEYDILFEALRFADWQPLLPSPHLLILAGDKALDRATGLLQKHASLKQNGVGCESGRILFPEDQPAWQSLQEACSQSDIDMEIFSIRNPQSAIRNPEAALPQDSRAVVIAAGDAHQNIVSRIAAEAARLGVPARSASRFSWENRFVRTDEMVFESLGLPLPGAVVTFSDRFLNPSEWDRLRARGIRTALWCYDDPFRSSLSGCPWRVFDQLFCYDPFIASRLEAALARPVEYLPAAATFPQGVEGIPPWRSPSSLDVTFVGSTGLQRMDERIVSMVSAQAEPFASIRRYVFEHLERGETVPYEGLLSLPFSFPGVHESSLTALRQDLATFVVRLYFLSEIGGDSLQLFGDRGWAEPALAGPLVRAYRGRSLDFVSETPWLYHHSKINLNLFNIQCVNSPTVRVFDAMACGGFMLSEYRPCLETIFQIGVHLDVFHTRRELHEKIRYYLDHEDERQTIARRGQDWVRQHHVYRHRLSRILGLPSPA